MSIFKTIGTSSNWTVMRALIRKDCRLFLVPTMGLLLLTATCYMIAMAAYHYENAPRENYPFGLLFGASVGGLYLVPLLAAVFGGVAIAGERSERTADFVALLPVSRRQIVMSKRVTSICILAVFVVFNSLVAAYTTTRKWMPANGHILDGMRIEDFFPIAVWLGLGMSLYGVAWLASTLTRSAPISACGSIAVTVAFSVALTLFIEFGLVGYGYNQSPEIPRVMKLGFWTQMLGVHDRSDLEQLAIAICATLVGLTSLRVGTVYYLKRIAP